MFLLFLVVALLLRVELNPGKVVVGDKIEIVGIKDTQETTVTGVEMFRKELDDAQAGDNVGLLLRGVERDQVERGQVLCKPPPLLLSLIVNLKLKFIF